MSSESNDLRPHEHQVEDDDSDYQGVDNELVAVAERHSGPIPHPDVLAGYEQVLPGSAERIVRMAEKNQDHQITIETKVLNAKRSEIHAGQACAVLVVFAAFAMTGYAPYLAESVAASGIGGSTVVGLAAVFLGERHMRNKASPADAEEE